MAARQKLDSLGKLDAPLAEVVQPAPEPLVVEPKKSKPTRVVTVLESDPDDDVDTDNSDLSDIKPVANAVPSVSSSAEGDCKKLEKVVSRVKAVPAKTTLYVWPPPK